MKDARVHPKKEYESMIGEYRVEQNRTIRYIAEQACVSDSAVEGLQNGMISPMYLKGEKAGQLKPWVDRICKVLRATEFDLFPRYFCELKKAEDHGLTIDQIQGLLIGESSYRLQSEEIDICQLKRHIIYVLSTLTPREEIVLRERFYEEKTLEEIGKGLCISGKRVREIEAKALRKLRHPSRSNKLEGYYFGK